jgi:hypothetical protein
MKMVSPFTLFENQLNCFKIDTNIELGNELRTFFSQSENNSLWKISTHRQTVTHALRHTEAIHLRYLKDLPKHINTLQANQVMEVATAPTANLPIFEKAISWFETALKNTGANNVEFGRIFVSKLAPHTTIDLHTDEGRYFSYYDRFHYTVTAAEENYFIIADENCILEQDSLFWVDNHIPHWLENKSDEGRINFIIDARLT